ncbi:phage tail spike protein [Halobacillus karajensis]|uniref:Tail spike domain-containing protein n=1 Tax=Halobacillus karajensis TaxID=195088 RepID=A0A059NW69_9BACI|nr:phage tail spike protein [Halobacillus karajensis]CDQ22565.1 hypothetical protein BN983_00778 [Halobacillus karajensis]CDQ26047.1 hypothetical protein BN981_00258 [Halobacillus karajensis]
MIHILNREGTRVVDILSNEGDNVYWDDKVSRNIHNTIKFDFKTRPDARASEHLGERNRVIIQTGDGFFHEFIIITTVQQRDVLEVYTVGSQLEIAEDEPFPPMKREGDTINTALDHVLSRSRWVRGITEGTLTRTFDSDGEYKTPLQLINRAGALFDLEVRFRVEIEGHRVKGRYVDMLEKRGVWQGREIVHGKDLVNISNTRDNAEVCTALIGKAPPNEDGEVLVSKQKSEEARQIWGIEGEHRWDVYEPMSENQDMTQAQLDHYTQEELNKRIASVIEYEVDAVDLEHVFGYSHEKIRLGDEVRIIADDYNPAIYLKSRVIAEEYSVSDPSQKKFTLGEFIEFSEQDINAIKNAILRKVAAKANKILFDENGEVIGGLDQNPNFGGLYVGQFDSPSVPKKSEADMNLHVSDRVIENGNEPSDTNDGQSWDNPLRTIEEAVRRIPEQLYHTAEIELAYGGDFYEYVRINGINGSGRIILNGQGKWNTTLHNGLRFTGTQTTVEIKGMTIIPESTYEVFSTNAGTTQIDDCVIKGNQNGVETTLNGVVAWDNGNIVVNNSNFYDIHRAMYAHRGARVVTVNNKGTASQYGLYARTGGQISGYGTAPSGDVANATSDDGGSVDPTDITFETETDQTEPSTGTTTKQWSLTGSGSYTSEYNSWSETDVLQGQGYGAGPYRGCWFFGSTPSNTVAGKTIKQIRIYVTRAIKSGDDTSVPIEFRLHSHTSQPSGEPNLSNTYHHVDFKRREGKWVWLPSSFYSLFESGTWKGVGIYSGTANYARMNPSATLEITYEG